MELPTYTPESFDDIHFYNISSQEWSAMTITSPDGLIEYTTESERTLLGRKTSTIILKTDATSSGASSSSARAKRVVARLEFAGKPPKDRISYGFRECAMEELFPKLVWPQGFRRVKDREEQSWTWIGTRGEPTLVDGRSVLLAFYCPNLQRRSRGKDGKLGVAAGLTPEEVDLIVVGFIIAMRDADKLFGHLGEDVSPRSGFGGQNWMSLEQEGNVGSQSPMKLTPSLIPATF